MKQPMLNLYTEHTMIQFFKLSLGITRFLRSIKAVFHLSSLQTTGLVLIFLISTQTKK